MSDPENPTLARIRALMAERGLTSLRKVCEQAGVSYGAIAKLKQRPTQPLKAEPAAKLARFFNVPETFLALGETVPEALTPVDREVIRLLRALPDDEQEHWVALLSARAGRG